MLLLSTALVYETTRHAIPANNNKIPNQDSYLDAARRHDACCSGNDLSNFYSYWMGYGYSTWDGDGDGISASNDSDDNGRGYHVMNMDKIPNGKF